MLAVVAVAVALVCAAGAAWGRQVIQTAVMDIAPFSSVYTDPNLSTRGFYFEAPVDFNITAFAVPSIAGQTASRVSVIRFASFNDIANSAAFGGETFAAAEIWYGEGTTGTFIPISAKIRPTGGAPSSRLEIRQGDALGILGVTAVNQQPNVELYVDYAQPASLPYQTSIRGVPAELHRLCYDDKIADQRPAPPNTAGLYHSTFGNNKYEYPGLTTGVATTGIATIGVATTTTTTTTTTITPTTSTTTTTTTPTTSTAGSAGTTTGPASNPTVSDESSSSTSPDVGLLVGVVVAIVLCCCLAVLLLGGVVYMKRRRRAAEEVVEVNADYANFRPSSGDTSSPSYQPFGTTMSASPTSAGAVYSPMSPATPTKPASNSFSSQASLLETGLRGRKYALSSEEIELGPEIGRGAFGQVYSGRYRGMAVAIKEVLADAVTQDSKAIQEFLDECELMKAMNPHRNIVQLIGVCSNPLWVVTELYARGSLDNLLRDEQQIFPNEPHTRLAIIRGISLGMLHLEKEGVIHKDLAAVRSRACFRVHYLLLFPRPFTLYFPPLHPLLFFLFSFADLSMFI